MSEVHFKFGTPEHGWMDLNVSAGEQKESMVLNDFNKAIEIGLRQKLAAFNQQQQLLAMQQQALQEQQDPQLIQQINEYINEVNNILNRETALTNKELI